MVILGPGEGVLHRYGGKVGGASANGALIRSERLLGRDLVVA